MTESHLPQTATRLRTITKQYTPLPNKSLYVRAYRLASRITQAALQMITGGRLLTSSSMSPIIERSRSSNVGCDEPGPSPERKAKHAWRLKGEGAPGAQGKHGKEHASIRSSYAQRLHNTHSSDASNDVHHHCAVWQHTARKATRCGQFMKPLMFMSLSSM